MTTTAEREVIWVDRDDAIAEATIRGLVMPARSVLDIGTGIRPQMLVTPRLHICVEPYQPYIERLRTQAPKDREFVYLTWTWDEVLPLLPDDSVDVVFALDVIEHLEKDEGLKLLHDAKRIGHPSARWAGRRASYHARR